MAATFYGSDSYCLTDVGLIDVQVTDPRTLIGQRLARRLQTPRGGLAAVNGNPDFGFDVRQFVNAKIRPGALVTAQAQIEAECLKEEQVASAAVRMTFNGSVLTIAIHATTDVGPFDLTLNVGQLTVEALIIT